MKRILALVLTLALCLSLWIPAGAAEPEAPALPTDQEIMDYALYFMTESQEDPGIVIRDFAHLTDGAGNPTGYYVSFNNEEGPAGYVLLSLISGENPIVEGAFEGGGLFDTEEAAGLFSETQLATLDDEGSQEAQIIYRGPEQIYLPVEGDTYYSVYRKKTVQIDTGIVPYEEYVPGVVDWSYAQIINSSVFKIRNFGSGTDYRTMLNYDRLLHPQSQIQESHLRNCAPTAGANILWYWAKKRGFNNIFYNIPSNASEDTLRKETYRRMLAAMSTDESSGTDVNNILNGFIDYFSAVEGNKLVYKEIYGTDIRPYQTALKDNCPILLSMHYNYGGGHSVMALGYAQSYVKKDDGTYTDYLFIMDGYFSNGRFIQSTYHPNLEGLKIKVI